MKFNIDNITTSITSTSPNKSNVYTDIQIFLTSKASHSINTAKSYQSDIISFFQYSRNKSLSQLHPNDLKIKNKEIISYSIYLKDKGFVNSTINRKISSIKSLYKFLLTNEYDININAFDIDNLPTEDSITYGILDYHEIKLFIETVKSHNNGIQKSLIIELAVKTSIREDALLNLTWNDIIKSKDSDVYQIITIDKGMKHKKSICGEFYRKLESNLPNSPNSNKIFSLGKTTMKTTIRKLCQELNIPSYRNITFHSLKKSGIREVGIQTGGNLQAMQKMGNHKNINTTIKFYTEMNDDPSSYECLLVGKEIDFNIFNNMSKEELLQMIHKSDRVTRISLLNNI